MKKFLFSLTMLAAVALAGFTTSCADGGNDDNNAGGGAPAQTSATIYESSLNVQSGTPNEIEEGIGTDLGTITENVKIELNSSQQTLNLSIKGIDLSEIQNLPEGLNTSFDIELKNVPYTASEDVNEINYLFELDEELFTTDLAIDINGNNAYLVSLTGTITDSNLKLTIFVVGDEYLHYIPIVIVVDGQSE